MDPLPPSNTQRKVEEIRAVLEDIKSQAATVETNLSQALKPTSPAKKKTINQLQKESKKLLAEVSRYPIISSNS